MPVYHTVNGQVQETYTTVPVVDVQELLDYIHVELGVRTPPSKTEEFWQHLRDHGMPHAASFPGSDRHVPFSLYGDECVLGDPKDKVTGIYLQMTMFKPQHTREAQFLLFAMQDADMVHTGMKTLEPVLKHIVWSCNNAYEGVYPACDSSGRPLTGRKLAKAGTRMADDRRYACAELKGDWKWHERWLRLQATPVCRQCCYLCGAQAADTPMRYYAIGDNPPWASTEVSTPGFIMNKVRPGILSLLSMS